jgi:DNA-binding XRE family transcriptional regulator
MRGPPLFCFRAPSGMTAEAASANSANLTAIQVWRIIVPMISPTQILMARSALRLTQAEVAAAASLSTTAYNAVEQGQSDPKVSTMRRIQAALEARGAVFGGDGGVRIGAPRAEFLVASPDIPVDRAARAGAVQILNAWQKSRGKPPLITGPDEDE